MRIRVIGDCEAADVLRKYLQVAGFTVAENNILIDYTVKLVESSDNFVTVDGIDCELERYAIEQMERLGVKTFMLNRHGGTVSDREISIAYPKQHERAVEIGMLNALLKETQHPRSFIKRVLRKLSLPIAALLFTPSFSYAQLFPGTQTITFWDSLNLARVGAGDSATRTVRTSLIGTATITGTVNQGTAAAGTAGWPIIAGNTPRSSAAWTSATAIDTTLALSVTGYPATLITVNTTSTFTAGTLNFEASDDGGTTWFTIGVTRSDSGNTETTYILPVNTKQAWQNGNAGFSDVRIRLNPAITGTGTATIAIRATAGAVDPSISALLPDVTGASVTLGALNATAQIVLSGRQSASSIIATGNLVGTVSWEESLDGGATWIATTSYIADGSTFSSFLLSGVSFSLASSIAVTGGATHARVRVSAYTSGSATASLRAVMIPNSFVLAKPTLIPTYTCTFRLAGAAGTTPPFALSKVMVANTETQFATIYHAATAIKLVKIASVRVWTQNSSVAAKLSWELRRLGATTAPATGNPAITPLSSANGVTATAETTCLALPTTAGSEPSGVSVIGSQELDLGVTGAVSVLNPIPIQSSINLWPPEYLAQTAQLQNPSIRALFAEGWAVSLISNAATTVKAVIVVVFTEE